MLIAGSRVLSTIVVLVAAATVVVALAWVFQRRLIYIPMGTVPRAEAILPGCEEVGFETADGFRLGGWFLPAASDGTGATVVVFNGNAGNRSYRAPLADALSRMGLSVLLFDYRGFGGNPGRPSESGLLADARAARSYVVSRGDVDPGRVVYFGESLGAAVAVALAVEHPPAALILRSPFTSLTEVGSIHYPFLPVRLLLSDRFPSVDRVGDLSSPLLIVAGDRDRIVPLRLSTALLDRAPQPKRMVVVRGAGHNDMELLAGRRLLDAISRFLTEETGVGVPVPTLPERS